MHSMIFNLNWQAIRQFVQFYHDFPNAVLAVLSQTRQANTKQNFTGLTVLIRPCRLG